MKQHSLPLFLITFFFFLTRISLVFSITSSNLPLQLISLLTLKSSFHDQQNTFNDWDPTLAFSRPGSHIWCSWSGIKCDKKTNQITSLDLSRRNLSGTIPSDIINLVHLHHLNLSGNAFDGPLQTVIFEFPFLKTLDISHNNFNSTFPSGVSRLKSLTHLNAYSNNFTGPLPEEVVQLPNLEYLNFGGSYFIGEIPKSYGGLTKLKFLHLSGNCLTGPVLPELGFLKQLEHMEIGYQNFTGFVPDEFSFLSNLNYLDISQASLSGNLPVGLGNLTKLETLLLFKNHLFGPIPLSFAKLTSLKSLDLSDNNLSGTIPEGISGLKELTLLHLMNNKLTGEIPQGIGELPNLELLSLWNNSLTGILPQKLGSNAKLQQLDVSSNNLSGPIPPNLCLSENLVKLIMFSNQFIGELPSSLANCTALVRCRIQNNRLNGSIPLGFGFLPNLSYLDLSKNNFSGPIPSDFGNSVKVDYLNISENSFNSELPDNIWSSLTLQIFSASYSGLVGNIPNFKGCRAFYTIELEGNNLTGSIPWDIEHCEKLVCMNFRRNLLTGIIPWEISAIPSISEVDLSHNFLTGTIPSHFANSSTLESFNVSYNQLTGPVPSSGSIFSSLHSSNFIGNEGLCGTVLQKPCRTDGLEAGAMEVKPQPKKTAGAIVWIMAAAFGIGLFVLIAGSRCFQANYSRRFSADREVGPWKLTAFQRLNFTAHDVLECLTMTDKILGMGSTGTVYKAEMPGGETIAVKKLWGKHKEAIRQRRGVLAEVDVLGNVRHRNIVRLLGCCNNNECTMLLYEYMPNGSLDDLLHGKNKDANLVADWLTRYKIALGVAHGICYLHHDCDPVIVHRDLKPSNILLDGELEARVADFGVAKLIQCDESMSVIAGSYGYIAPEYAYTLQVDEKSDIYSYGVVLMEILSGKRSVEPEFGDGNSIVDWVKSKIKIKNGINDVLDKSAGASCISVKEEMMLLLRVALLCTSRNPADRPSMRDVISMLQEAKPKRKLPGTVGAGENAIAAIPLAQKASVEC
ncbi:Leucine-rich repeat receptor-like protein kinase TDR [Capsicum annuum]|uniref:non-specific serine/threonine protein kinase n=1 Tax=Capsicum annuum TaxID=4072 RepID=A0A1U8GA70_CAPAN|nr:leucine-rich repeat receptor-like protein kinase TDR [Capsicum annuum]KAF3639238.1 Leucine-rich repeat receptor-like protein kinase TDR [Capsicum annuum]KAF3669715.1 Leucine-rich repeat receptor-like protein kinase TDR [Capsicum annuum]PHT87010.1 Leucine-rich repeat receptor-like protein kinase TDR [Capsicum annuum]